MIVPIENEIFVCKSCWCGICSKAACGCLLNGRWQHCVVNYIIELDMADKLAIDDVSEDN